MAEDEPTRQKGGPQITARCATQSKNPTSSRAAMLRCGEPSAKFDQRQPADFRLSPLEIQACRTCALEGLAGHGEYAGAGLIAARSEYRGGRISNAMFA